MNCPRCGMTGISTFHSCEWSALERRKEEAEARAAAAKSELEDAAAEIFRLREILKAIAVDSLSIEDVRHIANVAIGRKP